MRRRLSLVLALLAAAPAPAWADPPALRLPLDCQLGESCWLVNYPDADPGAGAQDFTCRHRSYDRHTGTDIALRDHDRLAAGVPVVAVADGKVLTVRDGVEDGLWLKGRKDEVLAARRECGNRVAIAHGDGWVSDYCHLRQGSLRVQAGDSVTAGQMLGLVGLSGMSEFPHAHVGILRFAPGKTEGVPVDPFTGADLTAGCGQPPRPLWAAPPPYQAGDLYAVGFADHLPLADEIKRHAEGVDKLDQQAPALVVWGALFGVAAGDSVTVQVRAPDGSMWLEKREAFDRDQAWRLVAVGRKRPPDGWRAGLYSARISWERPGRSPQARVTAVWIGL